MSAAVARVRWQVFGHSSAFLLGVSMVFISFGIAGGLIGDFLFRFETTLRLTAGVFLVFFGLLMLRVIPLPLLQREFRAHLSHKPSGYAGSVLVGLAFGAGWSPCIGPILAGIITVASLPGSAWQGGVLLAVYSLGFAVPFLIIAQLLPFVRKLSRYVRLIERIGGVLLVLVGVLLLSNAVNAFAPYLASLGSLESLLGTPAISSNQVPLLLYPLAFAAGSLSFLSPCVLPILPSFLAYLTGVNAQQLIAAPTN